MPEDIEFDMWEVLHVSCAGYNSKIDEDMIGVLCGIRDKKFSTDIANDLKLPEEYVELLQAIVCSAGLAEYGTSPRGCWFDYHLCADEFIEKCNTWFKQKWAKDEG